jgi:hypothetical protein
MSSNKNILLFIGLGVITCIGFSLTNEKRVSLGNNSQTLFQEETKKEEFPYKGIRIISNEEESFAHKISRQLGKRVWVYTVTTEVIPKNIIYSIKRSGNKYEASPVAGQERYRVYAIEVVSDTLLIDPNDVLKYSERYPERCRLLTTEERIKRTTPSRKKTKDYTGWDIITGNNNIFDEYTEHSDDIDDPDNLDQYPDEIYDFLGD